jgi:hypothetical protein
MFISVDMDCYLNVTLKSGNETVNQTVTGFNEENSLKEWKKIEIENNFAENAKLMFFRGHSSGRKEGYWAVDNIAFCRSSVGNILSVYLFFIIIMNQTKLNKFHLHVHYRI